MKVMEVAGRIPLWVGTPGEPAPLHAEAGKTCELLWAPHPICLLCPEPLLGKKCIKFLAVLQASRRQSPVSRLPIPCIFGYLVAGHRKMNLCTAASFCVFSNRASVRSSSLSADGRLPVLCSSQEAQLPPVAICCIGSWSGS